jgi:hypothetical protein
MKIRSGFVSNSSSSSYIVIADSTNPMTNGLWQREYPLSTLDVRYIGGKRKFGWEVEHSGDFPSKLWFAYMQAVYAKRPEWVKMLEEVITEVIPHIEKIVWPVNFQDWKSEDYGYIDHQSAAYEDGINTEMFDDPNTLKKFLFHPYSYIKTDNDNH